MDLEGFRLKKYVIMTTNEDLINIKAFKKVFNNFVQENEKAVRRKLKRGGVGSKSFTFNPLRSSGSPRSLGNSPARRSSFTHAITMESYELPEISPRDHLKLKYAGKSKRDFKRYVNLVSPRINREDSWNSTESDVEKDIEKQLNNLRCDTSPKKIKFKKTSFNRLRSNSI